jgi:hypothetical protein
MTPHEREVMQQALDDFINLKVEDGIDCVATILALRKALEQPEKEWVGLTEQERNTSEDYCKMMIGKAAFDAIEAKLKKKNT